MPSNFDDTRGNVTSLYPGVSPLLMPSAAISMALPLTFMRPGRAN